MRGARGSGKAMPSSPSVDALAAIAARKAAKIEKSLNKVPAMQLIADQLARDNSIKAKQAPEGKPHAVKTEKAMEGASMASDATSDAESASSVPDQASEPTRVLSEVARGASKTEVFAPSSTREDEDVEMADADLLADFDLDSGSEKDFFLEQLRIAPQEEVDMLLSSLQRTVKPAVKGNAPTATDKTEDATQALLKREVADFARKRAAAIPEGTPTKEVLNDLKEEVYMYGIGLNLGETQALLAAAKAESDIIAARGSKTMKNQLTLPAPPVDSIDGAIQHITKIQEAVGELFKDLSQPQKAKEPASEGRAAANKRKRGRASKSGNESAAASAVKDAPVPHPAQSDQASKRQKTTTQTIPSPVAEQVTGSDPTKLTRKQKQELYRQELVKKKPVIAKSLLSNSKSAPSAPPKAPSALAVVPSSAQPLESNEQQQAPPTNTTAPAQKTRQRARKSAAQKELERVSQAAAAPSAVPATSVAPIVPAVETDGFVDMRAPKKKSRGRKSSGLGEDATTMAATPENILGDTSLSGEQNEVSGSDAVAAVETLVAPAAVISEEGDKGNKSKSKRQSKINKRKSLGNDLASNPSSGVSAATSVATAQAKSPAPVIAQKPSASKQTPVPPPSRAILPPRSSASVLQNVPAPAPVATTEAVAVATPAAVTLPSSTTPILPPSSVSKLVLKSTPAMNAATAGPPPTAPPKAASSAPLDSISAPNASSKGRKRGSRKSGATADEAKENHS